MATVPVNKVGKIEFFEEHIAPWTANAVAIGTTALAVTDLQTKTEAARAAYEAHRAAQNAAKAATVAFNSAVGAMVTAGTDILWKIRAQGVANGDSVYELAQIPVPSERTPVGNPGTPFDFKVELYQNGALDLSWKCTNPPRCTGVTYQVWRRIGGTGELVYLGGVGQRKFLDAQIPPGASLLTYQIQAVRSTGVGNWATFNVSFGPVTPGMPAGTVSVTPGSATPKIAA